MQLDNFTIRKLSERAGCDVSTTAGAATLCYDIETVTGERLSLNTIKRLTGVIVYKSASRVTTLDIIARYLGYESWRQYLSKDVSLLPRSSAFVRKNRYIKMYELPEGQCVKLIWDPGRILKVRHIGAGSYKVEESVNGKLQVGDRIQLAEIEKGLPFIALEVERRGMALGSYVAGTRLSSIEML